jgi:hypothetical protein
MFAFLGKAGLLQPFSHSFPVFLAYNPTIEYPWYSPATPQFDFWGEMCTFLTDSWFSTFCSYNTVVLRDFLHELV